MNIRNLVAHAAIQAIRLNIFRKLFLKLEVFYYWSNIR